MKLKLLKLMPGFDHVPLNRDGSNKVQALSNDKIR
jgi:hypothetical protein